MWISPPAQAKSKSGITSELKKEKTEKNGAFGGSVEIRKSRSRGFLSRLKNAYTLRWLAVVFLAGRICRWPN